MNYAETVKPITSTEKWATMLTDNAAFLESQGEGRQQFLDNVALDYLCFAIDEANDYAPADQDDLRKVYDAAKAYFAQGYKRATFDLSSSCDVFGVSPWCADCDSPEEWVLHYSRRFLERDECSVPADRLTSELRDDAKGLIADLIAIGLTPEFLNENLETLTHCESALDDEPTPEQIEEIVQQSRGCIARNFAPEYLDTLPHDDYRQEMRDPAKLEEHMNWCEASDRARFAEDTIDRTQRREWVAQLRKALGWSLPTPVGAE